MAESYKAEFISGGVVRHILSIALPTYLASFIIQLTDLLVLLWVGQIGSQVEIAGLAVAMAIFFFAFTFNIGTSIATANLISRAVVKDVAATVRSKATACVFIAACVGWAGAAIVFLMMPFLCDIFGITGEAREVATRYLALLLPVNGVQAISMAMASVMRALGKARIAMIITLSGAAANLIADPILIFYAGMGVQGAAVGVWIGRLTQVVVGLYFLRSFGLLGGISRRGINDAMGPLLAIALPAALASSSGPLGDAILLVAISPFGDSARAAIMVVDRLSTFIFGFAMSLAPAAGIVIAQNFEVARHARVRQTTLFYLALAGGYIVAWTVLYLIFGRTILGLFNLVDVEALDLALFYLPLVGAVWLGYVLAAGADAVFQNTGLASFSMYANWARATLGMMPCWIMAWWLGTPEAAVLGFAGGMLTCGLVAVLVVFLFSGQNRVSAA